MPPKRLVLACLALSSCSAAPDGVVALDVPPAAPADDTAPAAEPEARATEIAPSREVDATVALLARAPYLVWATDASGDADDATRGATRESPGETFAVDEAGAVLGRVPYVVVRAGGALHRWSVRSVEEARVACQTGPDAELEATDPELAASMRAAVRAEKEDLAREPTRAVDEPAFEDLATGERNVVASFDQDDDAAEDFSFTATMFATVGSLAFVREDGWWYTCGAHGVSSSQALVVDLATGDVVEHVSDGLDDELARARGRAATELRDEREENGGWFTDEPPDFVQLEPAYGAGAVLRLDARFAGSTCYACSHGWSSYSAAFLEPVDAARATRLAPFVSPPAAVAAFARAHPTLRVGGYSSAR